MSFKDHFSRQSAAYSRFRPGYPPDLIDWVASQAPDHRLAVDCATGNGQAAVALAGHFDAVLALDGSLNQLRNAVASPRVAYVVGIAERLPVADRSVSLVAAAQAAHWFDFGRFHAECHRVLVPGGIVAAWTYEKFRVDAAVDAVIDRFYSDVVGRFWPPERRYVEEGYRTLPFPWREGPMPAFALETDWYLDQVMNYLATWSSVQRYKDHYGRDPLPDLRPQLARAWRGERPRRLRWPIHVRLGRAPEKVVPDP
jgi:ubiquinone/menaquinone biosynthesis C-methylase UbiE